MAYSDKVIDHYNHPRNVGQMDKSSTEVGTGLVGAPECGDSVLAEDAIRAAIGDWKKKNSVGETEAAAVAAH